MAMFSSFHAYDDEGYYLVSLNDYLAGHPLLTGYSPLYGPFFFELYAGLFKVLGLTPDNDTGGIVTAIAWVLASLGGGLLVYRLTRNLWLGVAAILLTFSVLAAMTNEPMATYGMVSVLLLVIAGAAVWRAARPRATAAVIGAAVGALLLIKINIGVLAAVAVVFAWAAGLEGRWRRLVLWPLVGAMAILPLAWTSALLSTTWVLSLALVVAISLVAIALARPQHRLPQSIPWFVAGGGAIAAVSLGVAVIGGTHVGDFWAGLVVAPLRLTQAFTVPLSVGPVHVVIAALSLLAASLRGPVPGLVRVGVGFFILLSLVWLPNGIFPAALTLSWLAVRAPEGEDPAGPYARALLPALAVLETLQTYPIAGTQASMAGFGLIPVGALILGDGVRQLSEIRRIEWVSRAMTAIDLGVVLVLTLTATAAFVGGTPVGVPGMQQVRLRAQQADDLRRIVAAVDANCDAFITLPSMDSLYVWTRQDPPTPVLPPIWWLVLSDDQQRSVVAALQGRQRVCIVQNSQVLAMRSMGRPLPSTPMLDFIGRSFVHQGFYGDYELLVSATS